MNYQLFELINGAAGRHDGVDDLMEFGATWLIWPVFALAAALAGVELYRRRLRQVVDLGVTLVLAFVASTVLAHLSTEVRPFQTHAVHQLVAHGPGASLPSDHATAAFALAVGVGLFLHRGWGWVLAVAAFAIGFARIWVGVHYPGDVAAAALIAVLAGLVVQTARRVAVRRNPAG
ncbi:phosphatase PAP2 family protein [Micromonosporaceae bacterium Da 78-11]